MQQVLRILPSLIPMILVRPVSGAALAATGEAKVLGTLGGSEFRFALCSETAPVVPSFTFSAIT